MESYFLTIAPILYGFYLNRAVLFFFSSNNSKLIRMKVKMIERITNAAKNEHNWLNQKKFLVQKRFRAGNNVKRTYGKLLFNVGRGE